MLKETALLPREAVETAAGREVAFGWLEKTALLAREAVEPAGMLEVISE